MKFWYDWAMWERLCFVLVIILALVLIYSFCILIRNQRRLKKHAAAEAYNQALQDAELRPMLTRSSDIPFGARALERGVQIEGIWVSSSESVNRIPKELSPAICPPPPTPASLPTPMTGSPLKQTSLVDMSEDQEPLPKYPSASHVTPPSKALNGNDTGDDRSSSDHSQHSTQTTATTQVEPRASQEPGVRQSRQWFGPRSSWLTKSPISYKRGSTMSHENHRRLSSEEIRRRFSKLFDEQLQARPLEAFQLSPVLPAVENNGKRMSKSFLPRQ